MLAPGSSTTPDKSEPSVSGGGGLTLLLPSRMSASHGPTPEAATLIRSSPAAGAGRGTSSTTTTSGAPERWIRAAFMFAPLIVQETDPSRSLGLPRVRRAPVDGRAAQETDEFAISHANVPSRMKPTRRQRCASRQKFAAEGRDGSRAEETRCEHIWSALGLGSAITGRGQMQQTAQLFDHLVGAEE